MSRLVAPVDSNLPLLARAEAKQALVVDDSRLQRRILAASLKRWGYEVTEAASAEEAITSCQNQMPDLVLSDWVMPGMSGLEFCRIFRGLSEGNYSYFILLTSKSEKDEVARGLGSGADDFLVKPVNNHELRARITVGERIVDMQRELSNTNRLMSTTLQELQRVYDSLDKDLQEAKDLQQSLLRERQKTLDQGHISLLLRSSGHVGGDLVGFFSAGEGQLGLFGIDVSGHGISSALMTARLSGYMSGSVPEQNVALERIEGGGFRARPPAQTVAELNALVLNEMETEHYFTLLLAIVDLNTGHTQITQAGHPHPVILRADGTMEQVGTGGFPVGLLPTAEFDQFDVHLTPGDSLLMLSDGVTECPDPAGVLLEEEGLERILASLDGMRGSELLEGLVWHLSEYADIDAFPDDVSANLFDYTGPPEKT